MSEFKIVKMEEADLKHAITIFQKAYLTMKVPENEEAWFISDLEQSFDPKRKDIYDFYKIVNEQGKMVSFGALGSLPFTRGSWVLRWGTTDPDYQGKGLMTMLTEFRIKEAERLTKGIAGNIQVMARRPNIYKRFGFRSIYRRGPENDATHMVLVINQDLDLLEQAA